MKMLMKLTLSSASLLLILSSCDTQKVQRTSHEDEVQTKRILPADKVADDKEFNRIDLKKIHANLTGTIKTQGTAQANNANESIVDELGPIVLNNSYIQNPKFLAQTKTRYMLTYFNTALLGLLDTKSEKALAYLEKFDQTLTDGCSPDLKGCRNISFFRQDNKSAQIVVRLAKNLDEKMGPVSKENAQSLKDIQKYYDTLAMAFELRNVTRDQELEFLYLKRARDYATYFQSLPEDVRTQTKAKDIFRRHGSVFENIINSYPADPKNPKFREFVANFKPWSYSRQEENPFQFGTRRMFGYAAKYYLYEDVAGKSLSAEFKKALADSQKVADEGQLDAKEKLAPSFMQLVNDIKKNKTVGFILKTLAIDVAEISKPEFLDEYFYMIDRLYRGHLDTQEVGEIWRGSNQNVDLLLSRLENYMKIQVIDKIIETNTYMSEIVAEKDMTSESLIRETLARSRKVSDKWRLMLSQFDGKLATFLGSELRNSKSEGALKRANIMINSVRRNIKYVSVYPNMLLLTYYAADLNATIKVDTFWGKVEVPASDIIDDMLNGDVSPWFSFGNDNYALNKIELLYAYYFSLTTGTFETFGTRKDDKGLPNVDRKKFFQKVVRQYLQKNKQNLEEAITDYRNLRSDNDFHNTVQTCESLKSGQNFKLSLSFDEFKKFAATGNPINGPLTKILSVYKNSGRRSVGFGPESMLDGEFRASARTPEDRAHGLETRILFLQSMVDILVKNLQDMQKINLEDAANDPDAAKRAAEDQSKIDEIKKTANEEIASVMRLQDEYFNEVLAHHRVVTDCVFSLLDFERKREFDLIALEEKNLGAIYDFMVQNQGKSAADFKAILTAEKRRELGLVDGLDVLTEETYSYNQLNLFYRMKAYSESMQPAVEVLMPNEPMKDETARVFKTIGIKGADGKVLAKEEFVRGGLFYLKSSKSSYMAWLDQMGDLDPLLNKLRGIAALYRYEKARGFSAKNGITPQEMATEALKILSYIHITPETAVLLKKLGNSSLVDVDDLQKFILDASLNERGLLDSTYDQIADMNGVFSEGGTLALTVDNKRYFLFAPDKQVETMIVNRYVPFVKKSEQLVRDFNSQILALEGQPNSAENFLKKMNLPEKITYKIEGNSQTTYSIKKEQSKLELLSTVKRKDVDGRFEIFHNRMTGGFFKRSEATPPANVKGE